jgi:hypothetical protein
MDNRAQYHSRPCWIAAAPASIGAYPRLGTSRSRHGSISLIVIILVIASALISVSVLNSSLQALRIAQRNDVRAEMTAVAESELEWLFFNAKMAVMSGAPPDNPGSSNFIASQADVGDMPTTIRPVYLDLHRAAGWRVKRSVRHLLQTDGVDSSNGGSRKATLDFIEAKIILLPPSTGPFAGLAPIRIGRNLVSSQSTIFQYGVFFDGDLELNPGENYTINGDIYASGNAFIAPFVGKTLTVSANAKLRLTIGKTLNGSGDATVAGTTTYNPNSPVTGRTRDAPLFALTGTAAPAMHLPDGGLLSQFEELSKEENLLGGLDALDTAKARPDLFGPVGKGDAAAFPPANWTAAEKQEAENNVKRSLIAPPPGPASTAEYPNSPTTDDPAISVQRAYNRAGLIVEVAANGSVSIFQRASDGILTEVTSAYGPVTTTSGTTTVTTPGIASSSPTPVYDTREERNVQVTDLDIATLQRKVAANNPDFNGLIYVNLKNSSSTAPAAVRVINGESISTNSSRTGISIATNAGLYIKGSFNTVANGTNEQGNPTNPSCMLMADAITVLSYAWDDANAASNDMTVRAASTDNPATTGTVEDTIQVNAGLITGNTASTTSYSSGGAQNLVRYLENWKDKNVGMLGSLGRVFSSKHFSRSFRGTGWDITDSDGNITQSFEVYRAPNRTVTYDPTLAKVRPAGSPILTGFSKGDVFRF